MLIAFLFFSKKNSERKNKSIGRSFCRRKHKIAFSRFWKGIDNEIKKVRRKCGTKLDLGMAL